MHPSGPQELGVAAILQIGNGRDSDQMPCLRRTVNGGAGPEPPNLSKLPMCRGGSWLQGKELTSKEKWSVWGKKRGSGVLGFSVPNMF